MKKALLVTLLLAIGAGVAGAYQPLVREGVKWEYMYSAKKTYDNYYQAIYTIELKGDTTFDDHTYFKAYRVPAHDTDRTTIEYLSLDATIPLFFIREDAARKVYGVGARSTYDLVSLNPYQYADGETMDELLLYKWRNPNRTYLVSELWFGSEDPIEIDGVECAYYLDEDHGGAWIETVGYVGRNGDLTNHFMPQNGYGGGFELGLTKMTDAATGRIIYKGPRYGDNADVNVDSNIDGSDVNVLIDAVLGKEGIWDSANKMHFDVNCDHTIDGSDINMLIDFVLGK